MSSLVDSLAHVHATDNGLWLVVLATCALPTLVLVIGRVVSSPAPRPLAALIAAWLAMWIGQFAVVEMFSAAMCVRCATSWWQHSVLAAMVYGVGMGIACTWTALGAMRLFVLGARLLGRDADAACAARGGELWPRALVGLAAALVMVVIVVRLPMPGGRWMPLVYLALVIVPTAALSTLVALAAAVVQFSPWRRRAS